MSQHEYQEEKKIDVKEQLNLHYWCEELNIKADELKDIVTKVGPMVMDVRMYIAKQLMKSWPVAY